MTLSTPKKVSHGITARCLHKSSQVFKNINDADFKRSPLQGAKAHRDGASASEIALLALAGHAVQKCKAGDFIVSKYDTMTMYCEDFAALQAFSRKVGASK